MLDLAGVGTCGDRFGFRAQLVLGEVIDTDQVNHLAIVIAQRGAFGLRNDPRGHRLLDLPRQIQRCDLARLDPLDPNPLFQRFNRLRKHQCLLQQPQRIAGLQRPIDMLAKPLARMRWLWLPGRQPCAPAGHRAPSRCARAGKQTSRIAPARKRFGKLRRKPCICSCA